MQISVQSNVADAAKWYDAQAAQVPFATALALTRTAGLVKDAEYREMQDVFDRPTPYTLNSLYTKSASKDDLAAYVFLKYDTSKGTPADKYLQPVIQGKERHLKKFERALRAVGALPEGYFAVPGTAAKLDSYGNMAPSEIVAVLSYFKAFPEAGYRANITDKRKARLKTKQGVSYFAGSPGDGRLPMGIWRRTVFASGSAIKPIIIFVKSVHYDSIYPFDYVGQITVKSEFPAQMREAMVAAMRTVKS